MKSDKEIDEIVDLLDNFIRMGGGHMDITFDDTSDSRIDMKNSTDCIKNKSCAIPTIHVGIDDND